ncbi:hypothetical protein IWZ00DRAFT_571362 [Phyllosticta capitalensis]
MRTTRLLTATAAVAMAVVEVAAQRPANTSVCDYYTTALLGNNSAANQATVLTLLVNTAVVGNYTKPSIPGVEWPDVPVPGILAPGTVNGTAVNLLPYFNGGLASSNRGGSSGVVVNFLDDGGALPLMMNKPANGTRSNQFRLLTHLYAYFGVLLGCTQQGTATHPIAAFPSYNGSASMYATHKYMALSSPQLAYFIQQVGLAASSFGIADADVGVVAASLMDTFGQRCSKDAVVVPYQRPARPQAICTGEGCEVAGGDGVSEACVKAGPAPLPGVADAVKAAGQGNASSSATASASGSASVTSEAGSAPTQTGGVEGEGGRRSGVGAALAGVVAVLAVLL